MARVLAARQGREGPPASESVAYAVISRGERRFAALVACVIVALAVAVAPIGHLPALEVTAFLPAVTSVGVVSMVLTAWLLYAQFRAGGFQALAILGLAYVATAILLLVYVLTFPRVFSATGLLGAGAQSAAFLHVCWHLLFCVVVICYVMVERRASATRPRFFVRYMAVSVAAALLGIIAAATLGHDLLPPLVERGRATPFSSNVVSPVLLGWLFFTNVYLIAATRLRTRVHTWLAVVLLALFVEMIVLTFESGGRYSFGWYFARVESAIAFTTFLMMLQSQYTSILKRISLANSRLERRNAQVEAFVKLQDDVAAALPSRSAVVAVILDFAQAITGSDGAALETITDDEVIYESASGALAPYIGTRRPRAGSLSGFCADSLEAQLSDDMLRDERVNKAVAKRLQIGSSIVVPLVLSSGVTLVLNVSSRATHAFSPADMTTLQLTATNLLGGLRAAQEYAVLQAAELEQRLYAGQLRALHVIASTTADRGKQIDDALRLGLDELALDWGFLGIIDEEAQELVIARSVARDGNVVVEAGTRVPTNASIFGKIAQCDEILVIRDVREQERRPQFGGWSSYIAIPLFIGGKRYGAIGFTSQEVQSEAFPQAKAEFLAVAGELIAAALERGIKNEQLADSETRYRILTDAVPQLVWTVDVRSNLSYANARWATYTGLSLSQGETFAVEAVIDSEYREILAAQRDVVPPSGFECEARIRRFDGVYRWHLVRAVPFRDSAEKSDRWIVTATDIEERKSAEAALSQLHHAALAATEAKSRFLATMSHEIRTPMNGVIGMAELLLLTELAPEQREYAQVVCDSGRSLLRLLNDILDYSKIEADKLELETVAFDLHEHVGSVERLLRLQFEEKGVRLASSVGPGVPHVVLGDPGRLRQILINLVGNALKFTAAGGTVEIDVTTDGEHGDRVPIHFCIRDTGIGIPNDVVGRLFQPFSQGDGSTTRRYGGTGLGLSISANLVTLMNGAIGVDSVPSRGSSFWFIVPFTRVTRSAQLATRVPDEPADFRPDGDRAGRILLVEDNDVNARLAIAQFKRIGFDIAVATNGRLALEAVRRERFDLIFMDCHMPEMDGYAATEAIRHLEAGSRSRIPIVAMTADAHRDDYERCLAVGMDDYLSKPTSLGELRGVVERWLPVHDRA